MRVLLAQINPIVGDVAGNTEKILQSISYGRSKDAELVIFPELVLSGYPPDDFLLLPHFIQELDRYFEKVVEATKNIAVILGTPRKNPKTEGKPLFNSAMIVSDQTLVGFQDKSLLPTYDVFDERRYFEPAPVNFAWEIRGKRVGVTICEDIWKHTQTIEQVDYIHDPIVDLQNQGLDFVVNLAASPFRMQKCQQRLEVCSGAASALKCPILLCNQVGGNDSLIFDGYSLYVSPEGELLQYAKGFEEDFLLVDLDKSAEPCSLKINDTEDFFKALVLGLRDYFRKQGLTKACLGISGGIDSAVVACIAAEALGKENVLGLMMPSRFSSEEGKNDAIQLIRNLGIKSKEISIEKPFQSYLDLLAPYFEGKAQDVTEENLQARIRGMLLMAFSNKLGYIVLSTGNKSELAMGYATLYGDMVGGLGVISDVTKMQVYDLARWINRSEEIISKNIIHKPPSAELREGQRDSDSLPDYAIVDDVLRAYVEEHRSPEEISKRYGYPLEVVIDLVKRIHRNEYKRRQSAPGLRVSARAFSVGRRFPIVQKWI
ncbi:MAG: Glutamine-dependent NAD(+) synthetase [Chlamydiae bacterium]|nr:Glutamine-dependent NAD(+) synthetase [Chlamydiota bacterium]